MMSYCPQFGFPLSVVDQIGALECNSGTLYLDSPKIVCRCSMTQQHFSWCQTVGPYWVRCHVGLSLLSRLSVRAFTQLFDEEQSRYTPPLYTDTYLSLPLVTEAGGILFTHNSYWLMVYDADV